MTQYVLGSRGWAPPREMANDDGMPFYLNWKSKRYLGKYVGQATNNKDGNPPL